MIFTPATWQEIESDADILRDNLENAVRQLTIEQRVITALRGENVSEETIEQRAEDSVGIVDEPESETEEAGQAEDRVDAAVTAAAAADVDDDYTDNVIIEDAPQVDHSSSYRTYDATGGDD